MTKFDRGNFQFFTVGKEFRLVEENTKTILIPKEEEAKEILEELRIKGFTKEGMRKAGQYCVNVYENDFHKMFAAGMLGEISEDLKDDYFALRDTGQYTDEMGVDLSIGYGEAVIM